MLGHLARVDLVGPATPLEPMARMGRLTGHSGLFVKRDDCMPLAFGGNKVRSLEYWVGDALAHDCDILVVAGGLASNQCRLTAAAAAKLGIETLVLYAGDSSTPLRGNAFLAERLGARIRRLGPVDEDERGRLARRAVADLERSGRRPYLVGDPITGALGYVRAAQELAEQTLALGIELRHVVLPGSMGATEAGMIFGAALLELPWTFLLVSVEYDEPTLRARLEPIFEGLVARVGSKPASNPLDRVRIDITQLGAGYGRPTASSVEAASLFARLEALTLEQTYVAKTFAGLLAHVRNGAFSPEEAVCVVHTGGTPSVFEQ